MGDRIAIYMPMIPELTVAMLACARIGAIHSIVVCSCVGCVPLGLERQRQGWLLHLFS